MNINERLKKLRKVLGLTYVQFAGLIRYSPSRYTAVENGADTPSAELIERVISATGVQKEWLIHGCGEMGMLVPSLEYQTIAERIALLWSESGLSGRKFAEQCGMSPSTIMRITKNEQRATERQMERIASGFHVGMDWLLFGVEEAKETPCDEEMIAFLNRHPEIRTEIYRKMQDETR